MNLSRQPLDVFEQVMKQGHEPKSNRVTFNKCKCGNTKFAYSDECIHCTHEEMKRLLEGEIEAAHSARRNLSPVPGYVR